MLDKPIEGIVYDDNGQVTGVTSQGETARTKIVVSDTSYFPDKTKKVGQVRSTSWFLHQFYLFCFSFSLPESIQSISDHLFVPRLYVVYAS